MCGISCITRRTPKIEHLCLLKESLRHITHRGHASHLYETWSDHHVALGCNRLPFTSTSNELQPAQSSCGRIKLLLNGEIYSFHPKREKIISTVSDTSQAANFIAQNSVYELHKLDGIYAFIAYDKEANELYFGRDPLGVKPLYYSISNSTFCVASEIKALSTLNSTVSIRHVPPGTIFRLQLSNSDLSVVTDSRDKYYDLDFSGTEHDYITEIRSSLVNAVVDQSCDQNRYGIFLSGGLDSTAIYNILKDNNRDVIPIVIGTQLSTDRYYVKQMLERSGEKAVFVECPSEESILRTIHTVIKSVESFEPNVVRQSSVSYLLGSTAHSLGLKAVFCGEGADELFGGYPEMVESNNFPETRKLFLDDLHRTQLQRVDRTSMAFTVEVRVPYLARDVVRLALNNRFVDAHICRKASRVQRTKVLLRRALSGMVSDNVLNRKKVVLSEGAGLRGNHPISGMLSDIVQNQITQKEFEQLREEGKEWGIKNKEEAFYFKIYREFGYTNYIDARERVHANSVHTL